MPAPVDLAGFSQILEAARDRVPNGSAETLLVSAHLAQMRLFMLRGGIEFFAKQDTYGQRREFIQRVVTYNKLMSRLEAMVDNFLIDGQGLLYFRPSRDLYRIHYFPRDQYRAFYDEEGDLEEVQIIYSYKVRPPRGSGAQGFAASDSSFQRSGRGFFDLGGQPGELRWVRLRVRMDTVLQEVSSERPSFGDDILASARTQRLVNSLGMIPAVEVFNNQGLTGATGRGEFDWLASFIMRHDRMSRSISDNLQFFGNPTLVSSRPRHDLLEPDGDGSSQRATVSSSSGFLSMTQGSSRVSAPMPAGSGGFRVPRIIANVEAADRVNYIVPDAVSGDQTQYARIYEEAIRAALGGVDDLSISSGATAYEVRTLYGRVESTASRKCRDLFTYGFCALFAQMIQHEETLFRRSLSQALQIPMPEPVLEEDLPDATPEQLAKAQAGYEKAKADYDGRVSAAIGNIKETGELPEGVVGLMPDGSTEVDWRWMGEVFNDSPQEILQKSIVVRNLQELGVTSLEALRQIFPRKTPEELAGMLGGYPFRMVEATQRSLGIFVDLIRAMFQVPHPVAPDLPLAADPNLDLTGFVVRTLKFLGTELSYQGTYHDADPATLVPVLSDADRVRAWSGRPTERDRDADERRAQQRSLLDRGWSALAAGQSAGGVAAMAGSDAAADGPRTDADSPAPGLAGGTLAYDPAWFGPSPGLELGAANGGAAVPQQLGSADLAAPTNGGLLERGDQPGGGNGRGKDAGRSTGRRPAAGRR